jgi:hypothetical protein
MALLLSVAASTQELKYSNQQDSRQALSQARHNDTYTIPPYRAVEWRSSGLHAHPSDGGSGGRIGSGVVTAIIILMSIIFIGVF